MANSGSSLELAKELKELKLVLLSSDSGDTSVLQAPALDFGDPEFWLATAPSEDDLGSGTVESLSLFKDFRRLLIE